jgi:hypothetical protein
MTIIPQGYTETMNPGIGLIKRRLPTEKEAIPVAISGIIQKYGVSADHVKTLETKYDEDGGDWYVALGFMEKRAIVKMDSVQGTITEIREI